MAENVPQQMEQDIEIQISDDVMEAQLSLHPRQSGYTLQLVKSRLKDVGVTHGILDNVIVKMIEEENYNTFVTVAKGTFPVHGKDGWYEYMFETEQDDKPKILADGSVDYSQYGNIPSVEEGEVIAKYHPAQDSKDGLTVRGDILVAGSGHNLAKLGGRGFNVLEDGVTYVARVGGKIRFSEGFIHVEEELVIDGDVSNTTGDVSFKNDVRIRGNVTAGMKVESIKGSIIVDGYVESATLKAGKEVTLKNGMQGGGKGQVIAGGDVSGKFFEQCQIESGGSVKANAIMNCEVHAGMDVTVSGRFGIVVGGHIQADRQIEATMIGNTAEVVGTMEAGIAKDFILLLGRCESQKQAEEVELVKINQGLEMLAEILSQGENEELEDKKRMLMRSKIEHNSKIAKLEQEKNTLMEQMAKANAARVVVDKSIFPGTIISVNGVRSTINDTFEHVAYIQRGQGVIAYRIEDL